MDKMQKKWMIAAAVVVSAVVVIVMGVLGLSAARRTARNAAEQTLMTTAQGTALAFEQRVDAYTNLVTEIGRSDILSDTTVPLEQKKAFLQQKADVYGFRSFGLSDITGNDWVSNTTIAEETYFQQALQGMTYMSIPFIIPDKEDMYVVIAAPVIRNDAISGVVYFRCGTETFQTLLDTMNTTQGGGIYVLDKDGTVRMSSDMQMALEQQNAAQLAQNDAAQLERAQVERDMVSGKTGQQSFKGADGTKWVQSYIPIGATDGWSLGVYERADAMENVSGGWLVAMTIFGLLFVGLAATAAWALGSRLEAVQTNYQKRLQQLCDGNFRGLAPDKNPGQLETTMVMLGERYQKIVSDTVSALKDMADRNLSSSPNAAAYTGAFQQIYQEMERVREEWGTVIKKIQERAGVMDRYIEDMTRQPAPIKTSGSQCAEQMEQAAVQLAHLAKQMDEKESSEEERSMDEVRSGLTVGRQTAGTLREITQELERKTGQAFSILQEFDDVAFRMNTLSVSIAVEASRGTSDRLPAIADGMHLLAAQSAQMTKRTVPMVQQAMEAAQYSVSLVEKLLDTLQQTATELPNTVSGMTVSSTDEVYAKAIRSVEKQLTKQADTLRRQDIRAAQRKQPAPEELLGYVREIRALTAQFMLENPDKM